MTSFECLAPMSTFPECALRIQSIKELLAKISAHLQYLQEHVFPLPVTKMRFAMAGPGVFQPVYETAHGTPNLGPFHTQSSSLALAVSHHPPTMPVTPQSYHPPTIASQPIPTTPYAATSVSQSTSSTSPLVPRSAPSTRTSAICKKHQVSTPPSWLTAIKAMSQVDTKPRVAQPVSRPPKPERKAFHASRVVSSEESPSKIVVKRKGKGAKPSSWLLDALKVVTSSTDGAALIKSAPKKSKAEVHRDTKQNNNNNNNNGTAMCRARRRRQRKKTTGEAIVPQPVSPSAATTPPVGNQTETLKDLERRCCLTSVVSEMEESLGPRLANDPLRAMHVGLESAHLTGLLTLAFETLLELEEWDPHPEATTRQFNDGFRLLCAQPKRAVEKDIFVHQVKSLRFLARTQQDRDMFLMFNPELIARITGSAEMLSQLAREEGLFGNCPSLLEDLVCSPESRAGLDCQADDAFAHLLGSEPGAAAQKCATLRDLAISKQTLLLSSMRVHIQINSVNIWALQCYLNLKAAQLAFDALSSANTWTRLVEIKGANDWYQIFNARCASYPQQTPCFVCNAREQKLSKEELSKAWGSALASPPPTSSCLCSRAMERRVLLMDITRKLLNTKEFASAKKGLVWQVVR